MHHTPPGPRDPSSRKALLNTARHALAKRDRGRIERLLEQLPCDSKKMRAVRARLRDFLETSAMKSQQVPAPSLPNASITPSGSCRLRGRNTPTASCCENIVFDYELVDLFGILMEARRRGSRILIRLGLDHAAFPLLMQPGRVATVHPQVKPLLEAWALLELEAPTDVRQAAIAELRMDFGRVLARRIKTS